VPLWMHLLGAAECLVASCVFAIIIISSSIIIVIIIIIIIIGLMEDIYYRLVGPWIGFRIMTVESKIQIQI
jgi:hypothetical protein